MSRPPAISGKNLVRALERDGFSVRRQTGSHVLLEHGDGRMVVVPVHANKDLPTGTLRGILRDAEISSEHLRDLL